MAPPKRAEAPKRRVTPADVRSHLVAVGFGDLLADTAAAHHCTPLEVCVVGGRPLKHVARARNAVWHGMRAVGLSYIAIARAFARDHSTIMTGVRAHKTRSVAASPASDG